MRKLYIVVAVAAAAIANMSVPASAMSPEECAQLQQQIKAARSNVRTGGYTMDPGYQTARAAEEAARDEMVRSGCNKRANAGTPICAMLIARVNEATANRRAMEGELQTIRQVGASAAEAELTARYSAECRNQARRKNSPPGTLTSEEALGIGVGIVTNMPLGRLGGPGPSGPASKHPGR